jgi:hypothetical protein
LFVSCVLRYAVPALALCVVGVVSFVALRSSRQNAGAPSSQVAMDEGRRVENQSNSSSAAAPENNLAANANTDGLVARATDETARGSVTAGTPAPQPAVPGQAGGGAGQGGAVASAPVSVEVTTEQPAPPPPAERTEVSSDAPAASKAGPVEEREADKKAENAPSKSDENKEKTSRGTEPEDVATNNDQYAQKRAQSRANEVQMPDGSRNRASNNQSNIAGGSLAAPAAPKTEDRDSAASRGAASRRAGRDDSSGGRSDDETTKNVETRAASGHRFRREGGRWVDVNYKSSMPSTGVRRGTEAYRVLVADMPEIGRAAEQLGGEVVIVIRSHAYLVR